MRPDRKPCDLARARFLGDLRCGRFQELATQARMPLIAVRLSGGTFRHLTKRDLEAPTAGALDKLRSGRRKCGKGTTYAATLSVTEALDVARALRAVYERAAVRRDLDRLESDRVLAAVLSSDAEACALQ